MSVDVIVGDCREVLADLAASSVQTCVTSPPYFGLRDYGVAGQIGLEASVEEYVAQLVAVFREVRRVLRDDGTLWLNLGDSYANQKTGDTYSGFNARWSGTGMDGGKQAKTFQGVDKSRKFDFGYLKPKDLIGVPWRVAFALQADGWYLRSDIIWHKPNPMPESVTDRPTKSHEYLFLLAKSHRYFYDAQSVMEPAVYGEQHASKATSWGTNRKHPNKANAADYAFVGDNHTTSRMADGSYGRNKRTVWTVATKPFKGAHFATFPPDLIEPCIKAGSKPGDTVLDPFGGAGTTGLVADRLGRSAVLVELNPEYAAMAKQRIDADAPLFAEGAA